MNTFKRGLLVTRKLDEFAIRFPQIQSLAAYNYSATVDATSTDQTRNSVLKDKKVVPDADPPSVSDVNNLLQFFEQRYNCLGNAIENRKLIILTGAGMSTESGIPDYRSPHGAYNRGFKPVTHKEFINSYHVRRRYWARSYAGWRRLTAAQPNAAHRAIASLEKVGRVNFMVTQNVDRLHHLAGSSPLELHGTIYTVICMDCGSSFDRSSFQEQMKALNPEWASAIENLEGGSPGTDESIGVQQRPDGDIEIDKKFWEEDFTIPSCHHCGGMLKPDVVLFGDNVPKERADKAMEAVKKCDALLILGSSLMTMSAFRLARAAYEMDAAIAIVNVGKTRADDFVHLKINAQCGEVLHRLLEIGYIAECNTVAY